MNDYRASEILYRFGEKHRPEKYIVDGVLDDKAWIEDYYKDFCRRFGDKPRRHENIRITETRRSLETDIYIYGERKSGILSLEYEKEIRSRIESAKEAQHLLSEYFDIT